MCCNGKVKDKIEVDEGLSQDEMKEKARIDGAKASRKEKKNG